MAERKSKLQTWLEYAVARTLTGALEFLPLPAARLLSFASARVLDFAVPKLRRVALTNLSFAFPNSPTTAETKSLTVYSIALEGCSWRFRASHALTLPTFVSWIDYEGLSNYLDAKKGGRGILVATAHLGNWELSAFAHALMTEPMHVMVRPLDNEGLMSWLRLEGRFRVTL